jgi:hypothetical protein
MMARNNFRSVKNGRWPVYIHALIHCHWIEDNGYREKQSQIKMDETETHACTQLKNRQKLPMTICIAM